MYLEPWQVFLGGCVIGTLISFIVLTLLAMNLINKIGVKGIHIQQIMDSSADEEEENSSELDILTKLSFILLNRGCISDDDVEFMMDHITFEEWKKLVETETAEMRKHDDNESD